MTSTAEKLVEEARQLIVKGGYHGFSYADLAERFGIRKASIHHHFPSKVDLVVAAIEQQRAGIRAMDASLESGAPDAVEQLIAYIDYWKRCIRDDTAPFCLAGVLAAELPGLPPRVGDAVRGHFNDLREWLAHLLALGVRQGTLQLSDPPQIAAEFFQTSVYGAMLMARAYNDPAKFALVVDSCLHGLRKNLRH